MSAANELLSYMAHRDWEPVILVNDTYILEINPVHGRLDAGFVLWRRLSNDEPELVTSAHASHGRFWGPENQPLDLDGETEDALTDLLAHGQQAQ